MECGVNNPVLIFRAGEENLLSLENDRVEAELFG